MLIDSQVAVWILTGDDRIGRRSRRELTTTAVIVSTASVWELTIKSMLGRLRVPPDLSDRLRQEGFTLLDVTAAHAEGLREFPQLLRHDPFDRLLVAQAHVEGIDLMTADRVLLDLDLDFLLDATV